MMNSKVEHDPKLESLMFESEKSWPISSGFDNRIMREIERLELIKDKRKTRLSLIASVVLAITLLVVLPNLFGDYVSMVFLNYALKLVVFAALLPIFFHLNNYLNKKKHFNTAQSAD